MTPTNNVWWMRCPSNAHGNQLGLVSWLLGLLIPKKDRIGWQTSYKIHESNHLQVPTIVHLPLYSPFSWT
jgi:hypothetical protein